MFHEKWDKLEHEEVPKNAGCKLFFVNVPDVPVQNVNEKRTTVHGRRILYNLEYLEQWNIGTQTTPESAYLLGKSCSTKVFHKGVNTWNTWNIFPRASKCTLVACRIHIRQADDSMIVERWGAETPHPGWITFFYFFYRVYRYDLVE